MSRQIGCILCIVALVAVATAAEPRLNPREFQVPGSAMRVQLWEQAEYGTPTPYWSVAFDGVSFSAPRSTTYEIPLQYATFDPAAGEPAVPGLLAAGADTHLYLVQYCTQPFEQYRAVLGNLGVAVHFPIPQNADLVTIPDGVLAQVTAQPFVRVVRPFQPAYRVAPEVLEALHMDGVPERYSIECVERGPAAQAAVASLVESMHGTVDITTPEGFRMEATIDPATLVAVARHDKVNRIELWQGPGGFDMDHARGPEGHDANYIESLLGLTGQGVRGEVFDTEHQRPSHQEFQNPRAMIHGQNGNSGTHGTYVYSEVFAIGVNAQARGMVPSREQGIFCWYAQTTQFGGSYMTRYEETRQLVDPNGPYRGVFQTSSVGSSQTGSYTTISAEVDDYLFMYDLLSCQSMSNYQTNQMVRPQAWAKNIVGVGGFYHNNNNLRSDDRWNNGASVGPASDGRIKPDLAAYYDSTYTATPTSDTSYWDQMSGTSGATPMTCGAFGMLFHMWHAGVWPGHGGGATVFDSRCHMATAKALMINSGYMYKCASNDPGQPGTPAYTDLMRVRQGWGQANLRYLADQAAMTRVIDETDLLTPLQTRSYQVNVPSNQPALKVTMVYTDPKGNPNIQAQHRINNLDLKVTAPNGTFYWGNNGLMNSSWSTSGGVANTKDTVENVFIQSPAAGTWTVEVIGAEIVQDAHPETPGVVDADYALVIYGGTTNMLGDMNCDGAVNFLDINPFIEILNGATPCNFFNADVNGDGRVDFLDINPFIALLIPPGL